MLSVNSSKSANTIIVLAGTDGIGGSDSTTSNAVEATNYQNLKLFAERFEISESREFLFFSYSHDYVALHARIIVQSSTTSQRVT